MIPPYLRDICSALKVAKVLGEISPKIRISKVKIPVAIPAPEFPHSLIAKVVDSAEADRLTRLLPIKIADNIFCLFEVSFNTVFAWWLPLSARDCSLIRLAVVKAVSADEKKAERTSKSIKIINFIATLGSNFITPILCIYIKLSYSIFVRFAIDLLKNVGKNSK